MPTKLLSVDSIVRLLYRNTATFFGVHVFFTPLQFFYYQLPVASGQVCSLLHNLTWLFFFFLSNVYDCNAKPLRKGNIIGCISQVQKSYIIIFYHRLFISVDCGAFICHWELLRESVKFTILIAIVNLDGELTLMGQ